VGHRADQVFLELKALLAPFGVTRDYSDKWAAYQRHLSLEQHTVGTRYMQKIERKHLAFRTRLKRLARQTLCFSRSIAMHDVVIGLFMNRYEFGIAV
jgi:insertion element IS1 protein InsB